MIADSNTRDTTKLIQRTDIVRDSNILEAIAIQMGNTYRPRIIADIAKNFRLEMIAEMGNSITIRDIGAEITDLKEIRTTEAIAKMGTTSTTFRMIASRMERQMGAD